MVDLKKLLLMHSVTGLLLLIFIFTSCVLASINFGSVINTFQAAWKPSLFGMFLALIIFVLGALSLLL